MIGGWGLGASARAGRTAPLPNGPRAVEVSVLKKQAMLVVAVLLGAIVCVAVMDAPALSSWSLAEARWGEAASETLDLLSLDPQEWSVLSLRTLAEGRTPEHLQAAPGGRSFCGAVAEALRSSHRIGDVAPGHNGLCGRPDGYRLPKEARGSDILPSHPGVRRGDRLARRTDPRNPIRQLNLSSTPV